MATGLQINESKSIIYHEKCDREIIDYIAVFYNIKEIPIREGMKYLRYHLKPSCYTRVDWKWIIDCYYKRISGWERKCLSMGGRVLLDQSVLAQLTVHWAHLFYIPASIIKILNRLTTNFIWGGCNE